MTHVIIFSASFPVVKQEHVEGILIRKIRILKIEKFAVELYDFNRFFANIGPKSN